MGESVVDPLEQIDRILVDLRATNKKLKELQETVSTEALQGAVEAVLAGTLGTDYLIAPKDISNAAETILDCFELTPRCKHENADWEFVQGSGGTIEPNEVTTLVCPDCDYVFPEDELPEPDDAE